MSEEAKLDLAIHTVLVCCIGLIVFEILLG
jgi:hypothetical protein